MAKRRKRGDGGLSLRKDGRWEGRVVIGYDDKGLPVTKNVLAKTKSECAAKLKALKESIKAPVPDHSKLGILLGDWLDLWYRSYKKPNLRPNTQMSYERRIYQHITPALGSIQIDQLTTNDIQQFYARLKKNGRLLRSELYGEGLSDQTLRGIHTTLHSALDRAVSEKLLFRNPADGCRLPSAKAREMQVLTPEEIQRLLIQAKEDGCYELLLLELSTGLRRGEICALQWDDLNFRTGELRIERQVCQIKGELLIQPPKTKASIRTVILPPPVVTALKKYKQTVCSRWMFPSPKKEDAPIAPSVVSHRLAKILKHAGCKKVRFHDLRHVFATNALEHGMDVKTLSAIIGHTSSATTLNIYAHVTSDMQRHAAAKIDQGIGKTEAKESAPAAEPTTTMTDYQPNWKGRRRWGTGSLSQSKSGRWTGRCAITWPDGKLETRSVHADTESECERLLAIMIAGMRAEVAAEKERLRAESKAG